VHLWSDTVSIPEPAPAGKAGEFLGAALPYAARGWSIIPVIGKRPAGLWKPFQEHPADEPTLRRLFARKGITGVAVVLGKASGGLACRDFDRAVAYHQWAAAHPDDAASLPTVQTARGFHVYGLLAEEAFANLGDGELRADSGHYCLLPPSRHPDGPAYSWLVPLPAGPLPALPTSLTAAPGEPSGPRRTQVYPLVSHICPVNLLADPRVEQAITGTIPAGPGLRRKRLFDLARALKGNFPDAGPDQLRGVVREWHRRALPFVKTKPFFTSWTDFVDGWKCVRLPAGTSFLLAAEAAEAGNVPSVCDELGYDGDLRLLAALCYHLQLQWADQPFPLGCRKAAEFLGCGKTEANRMLRALQFDGVIRLVKLGTRSCREGTTNKASLWRFANGK
jgi:hypothetical protein